jgi:serine/threonine-protein kinase
MEPADALFVRVAWLRGWISRPTHDEVLRRLHELRGRGIPKSAEDLLREGAFVSEENLQVLRRLLGRAASQASIGDYHVVRRVGIGGTGMVFEGRHRRTGRRAALKVLFPKLERTPGMVERFMDEGRILARVDHPNVVHAYDVGRDGPFYFIAMELVDGENLMQLLEREGPLPSEKALRLLLPIARALVAIHEAGLLHRDVKPGNILVSAEGGIKLVDLGLFFAADDRDAIWEGRVFGTPRYMAPEQLRGDAGIDARADLFSFGVTWYHLLTGALPFSEKHTGAMLRGETETPPPAPSKLAPGVPPRVDLAVMSLLRWDPALRRPASALELAALLESLAPRARGARGPIAREPRPRRLPSRRLIWGGASLAALGAVAAFALVRQLTTGAPPGTAARSEKVDAGLEARPGLAGGAPESGAAGSPPAPAAGVEPPGPRELQGRDGLAMLRSARQALEAGLERGRRRALELLRESGAAAKRFAAAGSGLPASGAAPAPRLSPSLEAWVERGAAGVDGRFLEHLGQRGSGFRARMPIRIAGGGGGWRLAEVRVEAAADGSIVLLAAGGAQGEGGESALAPEEVHPFARLIWGGFRGRETATRGIAYAVGLGRLDIARRLLELFEVEVPDELRSVLAGGPGAAASEGAAPERPDAEAEEYLQRHLSAIEAEGLAQAAFRRGDWRRAGGAFAALARDAGTLEALLADVDRWTWLARRSEELWWLENGLLQGRVSAAEPEAADLRIRADYEFEAPEDADGFRFRAGAFLWQKGRLVAGAKAVYEAIDTVAVFRLPITVIGEWAAAADRSRGEPAGGRLVVGYDDLALGLGGGADEAVVFRESAGEIRKFFTGAPGAAAGRFQIELSEERVRASLPGGVVWDSAIGFPVETSGRVVLYLEPQSSLESLAVIGIVDPIWVRSRVRALRESGYRPDAETER